MDNPTSTPILAPEQIAREYFKRMQDADPAVVELFAEGAELIGLGARVVGTTAIATFYERAQQQSGAVPEVVSVVAAGNEVFAEIFVRHTTTPTVHAVDVFRIKHGLIASLTYFLADYPLPPSP